MSSVIQANLRQALIALKKNLESVVTLLQPIGAYQVQEEHGNDAHAVVVKRLTGEYILKVILDFEEDLPSFGLQVYVWRNNYWFYSCYTPSNEVQVVLERIVVELLKPRLQTLIDKNSQD